MKKTNSTKKVYILSTLLFCIPVQSTEITLSTTETIESENETSAHCHNTQNHNQTEQNTHDAFNLNLVRKPKQNNNNPQDHNSKSDYKKSDALDTSFGPDGTGYVITQIGTNSQAQAVAIQKNNNIVIAGTRENKAVLVRYDENGLLDTSFGGANGTGIVVNDLGGKSFFNALAIQASGQKTITVGQWNNTFPALARYYENGTLDTYFGINGVIKTYIDGKFNAVAVQKDNKIVVTGYQNINATDTQIIVMRYNEYGQPDDTFGTQGVVTTSIGENCHANGIAIQKDHKIVIVGSSLTKVGTFDEIEIVIARYTKRGDLDTTFGSNQTGIVTIRLPLQIADAYAVTIQENDKIVVVGQTTLQPVTSYKIFTIRLNENGSVDNSFGYRESDLQGYPAHARSVALDENERIIVMGYGIQNTYHYFGLIRYNQDGSKDKKFKEQHNSFSLNSVPNRNTLPVVGIIQDDSKKLILVGNYSSSNSGVSNQFIVARYDNN